MLKVRALGDQLCHKPRFTPFTPQLGGLAAKVQHREFAFRVGAAQCAPFTLAAARSFLHRSVEWRVAHGQVKVLARLEQAQQNVLGIALMA
ncbi:hypothetical protein D3C85_1457060 [compost metagenome]